MKPYTTKSMGFYKNSVPTKRSTGNLSLVFLAAIALVACEQKRAPTGNEKKPANSPIEVLPKQKDDQTANATGGTTINVDMENRTQPPTRANSGANSGVDASPADDSNAQPPKSVPADNDRASTSAEPPPAGGPQTGGSQPPAREAEPEDSSTGDSEPLAAGDIIKINDLSVTIPVGWSLAQQATVQSTVVAAFQNAGDYVSVYSLPASSAGPRLTTTSLFANDSQIVTPEAAKKIGNADWKIIETRKSLASGPHAGTYYVTGFLMERGAFIYYGYARGREADQVRTAVLKILEAIQ